VIVKGKTEPVGVYEVLDYHTEESFPNLMEAVGYFKEAQAHYRACRWDQAIRSFGEAHRINPADQLGNVYPALPPAAVRSSPRGLAGGLGDDLQIGRVVETAVNSCRVRHHQ
jgi:hypothetical protein